MSNSYPLAKYSISYSTVDDIYALACETDKFSREALLQLAQDLEQVGIGYYDGEEFILTDQGYGPEVISMEDWVAQND